MTKWCAIRIEVLVGGKIKLETGKILHLITEIQLTINFFICRNLIECLYFYLPLFWFQSRVLQNLLVNVSAGCGGRLIVLEMTAEQQVIHLF